MNRNHTDTAPQGAARSGGRGRVERQNDLVVGVPPAPGTHLDTLASLPVVMRGIRDQHTRSIAWNIASHLAAALAAGGAAYAVALGVTGREGSLLVPTLIVAAATLLRGIGVWQEAYESHDLAFRVLARVRNWMYAALSRVSPGGLSGRRTGELTSAATNDSEVLEVLYAHTSLYLIGRWITTPFLVLAIAAIDPMVALATIPVLVLIWIIPSALRAGKIREGARRREVLAIMGADMQENVGAVREITASGLQAQRLERLDGQHRAVIASTHRIVWRTGLESAVAGMAAGVLGVVATVVGVLRVDAGALSLAWLPVVVTLAGVSPIAILQWLAVSRHEGNLRSAAERIEGILYAPDPLTVRQPAATPPPAERALPVRVSGLAFTWPGADRPAVDGVDLDIPAGQTVALAGRSGAGKSTLGQLIARWHDPDEGSVEVAGIDVRHFPRPDLPGIVTLLSQNPHVFAESVRDNLQLAGSGTFDDDTLWAALEESGAAQVVRRMPDGLDTVLADHGRSLSGGERQRLCLARVLLTPAPVLVLDEAVSQLDSTAEHSVRHSLTRRGGTTVIIAHRLATLLDADRIVVMDRGRIAGDGSHPALWRSCDVYRELVGPQLHALEDLRGLLPAQTR